MLNNNDNNNGEEEEELHEVGSNRPACASCKHQRKKCIEGDCVMWRHFPASKKDEFLWVHKVFGISTVTKKIKSVDDVAQQDEAIKSFLWEARLWQEDPVHGPLGEYRKLEQQLKEERRNNQLQIVQLPDVPQLPQLPDVPQLPPQPTTSESTIRYLPPLAVVDQNMGAVAPTDNGANDSMQGYNMLNSTVTNYCNLLRWHRHEGETGVTSRNGYDSFGNFPSHYNRPIEQMLHGFVPTSAGGIVHHPSTTYNNGAHHVQLHQPRYPYYMNLGQGSRGRRRKDHSDQLVSRGCSVRHVRGRGIGPINTTTSSSLAGPIIRQGPIISTSSPVTFVDSSFANARAMVNPSVNGRHVEEGRNRKAEDLAAVVQDFTIYNPNDLLGEQKQPDLESKDDSTSKKI